MTSDDFYDPKYPPSAPKPRKHERKVISDSPTVVELTIESGCDKLIHTDPTDPCATHYSASSSENKEARKEFAAMMSPLTPDSYFTERYGARLGKEIQERGRRLNTALKSGAVSIAHRTPLIAGGCPVGEGNLQPVSPECYELEKMLGDAHSAVGVYHRKVHGLS